MLNNNCFIVAASVVWTACLYANVPTSSPAPADETVRATDEIVGCRGTYNAAPRLANGRVDLDRLLAELVDLKANTYNWLIWHAETDWEDLQASLPHAGKTDGVLIYCHQDPVRKPTKYQVIRQQFQASAGRPRPDRADKD